jgi:hypothetical protein
MQLYGRHPSKDICIEADVILTQVEAALNENVLLQGANKHSQSVCSIPSMSLSSSEMLLKVLWNSVFRLSEEAASRLLGALIDRLSASDLLEWMVQLELFFSCL